MNVLSVELDRTGAPSIIRTAAEGFGCARRFHRALAGNSREGIAMAGRRYLFAVVFVAIVLHWVMIARTILPAQDGLKLIRVARQFQAQPWTDVIRGSDAHPLYPAIISLAEPFFALFAGPGPDTWRITAQMVSAVAAIGMLYPIYALTTALFDRRIGYLAAATAVILPRLAELGHDTLSDSVGLCATVWALWLGAVALRKGGWRLGALSGLVAGLGYLARPEVVLVPVAIGLTWLFGLARDRTTRTVGHGRVIAAVFFACLAVVGSYAAVKGEVSEKLAVRFATAMQSRPVTVRSTPAPLPPGLDAAGLDFSPKEETERIPIRNARAAMIRIADKWWEHLCWFCAVMTWWGLARQRFIRGLCPDREPGDVAPTERRLLLVFGAVHAMAVVRNSTLLGYLSGRHVMALVLVSLPWAAAGTFVCARGIAVKSRMNKRMAWTAGIIAAALFVGASITVQLMPNHRNHLSRAGHWAAGQWLIRNAQPDERVLDTRGWARFVSGQAGYDYWHVRQALTDKGLRYVVVGIDELEALSTRAETLNALLDYAAVPIAEFPSMPGENDPGVRIYRFERPSDWKGLAR
jgi:hypothetical protein